MNLVKLTVRENNFIYLNKDHIVGFSKSDVPAANSLISLSNTEVTDDPLYVIETPEQLAEMLGGINELS